MREYFLSHNFYYYVMKTINILEKKMDNKVFCPTTSLIVSFGPLCQLFYLIQGRLKEHAIIFKCKCLLNAAAYNQPIRLIFFKRRFRHCNIAFSLMVVWMLKNIYGVKLLLANGCSGGCLRP